MCLSSPRIALDAGPMDLQPKQACCETLVIFIIPTIADCKLYAYYKTLVVCTIPTMKDYRLQTG